MVDPGLAALAKLPPEVQRAFQNMNRQGINTPQKLAQAAQQNTMVPISSTLQYSVPPTNTNPPRPTSPITGQQVGTSPYGKPLTGRNNAQQQEAFRNNPQNQQVIQQIRDAALQRYGMTTDYTVLGLANKVQNEGYPLEVALQMLQQGYGYENNPNLRRAADRVAIEYDPQQNSLNRLLEEAQRGFQQNVRTNELYGQRADQSLQGIYGDLAKALGTNADALKGIYKQGAQGIEGGYDRALQAATGAVTGHQDRLTELASKLGIEEALGDTLPQIAEQLQFQTGALTGDRANALANINTLGTQQRAISQQGIGDSQRELAQNRANVVNQVLGAIGKAGINFGEEQRDIRGQLGDLAQSRGSALRLAIEDAMRESDDRTRQQKLDQLAEEIQRGSLDIQRGQLDLSKQELGLARGGQSFDQQLALQHLQLEKQKLAAQLASAGANGMSPYEQAQLQFKYDELDAKIAGLIGGGGSGSSKQFGGALGLDQFFNQPRQQWGESAGPVFRGNVYGIIEQAWQNAGGDPGIAYQNAIQSLVNYPTQDPELLRQAIDIAFKKF